MRYLFILPVILALLLCATQCKTSKPQEDTQVVIEGLSSIEKDFKHIDYRDDIEMPIFPGGEEARQKFLRDNVKYPAEAQRQKRQGVVVVGFVVDTDGTLHDIKIVKSVNTFLDAEALRVIKKMPKWAPAKEKDGTVIPSRYAMPVSFRGNF